MRTAITPCNPNIRAFGFFRLAETFHAIPGAPVYAYSAIFSPTCAKHKNRSQMAALRTKARLDHDDSVALDVRGGRGGGYRTYWEKTGITAVLAGERQKPDGALLGRIRFNVVLQASDPPLVTQIKN